MALYINRMSTISEIVTVQTFKSYQTNLKKLSSDTFLLFIRGILQY